MQTQKMMLCSQIMKNHAREHKKSIENQLKNQENENILDRKLSNMCVSLQGGIFTSRIITCTSDLQWISAIPSHTFSRVNVFEIVQIGADYLGNRGPNRSGLSWEYGSKSERIILGIGVQIGADYLGNKGPNRSGLSWE